jgi:hypothetical protein
MTDKHEILLRLPIDIFKILEEYKSMTGVSITNQIYETVAWRLITKGLISLDEFREKETKKEEPFQQIPEDIKYCDGDKCQIF